MRLRRIVRVMNPEFTESRPIAVVFLHVHRFDDAEIQLFELCAYILHRGDRKCFGDEDSARHGCSMQIQEEYPFQFFV